MKKYVVFIAITSILLIFIGCSKPSDSKSTSTKEPIKTDIELGKEIALATKGVLGKNLINAISTKGTAGAVDFCNIRAIPLTDSMAILKNAKVSRVSDQPRNPENAATGGLRESISKFKAALASGHTPSGASVRHNGKMVQVYPIITNALCIQCHGKKGTDIAPETLKVIDAKYPDDQATGYTENQIRGIWVVEMD